MSPSLSLAHAFLSLTTGLTVGLYPEEAVVRTLRPHTALHTRRQLLNPAFSEVIIVVTGLLSEHENRNQNVAAAGGCTHKQ